MKKSIICIVAAISVFVCSVLPVSASSGDIYYRSRLYPGRVVSEYTGYKYGNYNLLITLPAGSYSETSEGKINLEILSFDLRTPDTTYSGSITQDDSYVYDSNDYVYDYKVDHGESSVFIETSGGYGDITLRSSVIKTSDSTTGKMSYVYQGTLSFVTAFTFMPDSSNISGADSVQIVMDKFGWEENTGIANGKVVSSSYTVDGLGNRIDILDGYNNFRFNAPGGKITIRTDVDFSVVVPEVSEDTFSFFINLNSYVNNDIGDRWTLTPLQHYYDTSEFLDGFKDIFDDYWSESPNDKVSSGNVDLVVSDYDQLENQITGDAFTLIEQFDLNDGSFESAGEDFLFVTTWLSSMLMRMFAISFEFSTVFYVSMGLLLACTLVGIRRLWR